VFPFLLGILLSANPAPPPASNPAAAADGFVESLQGDQPATTGSVFANAGVRAHVNETLERFQCVSVDRYNFTINVENSDAATIVVDLDGTGVTARQRRLPLPRRWFLHVIRRDGAWSIDKAMTEEQRIVAQLLATSGDAAREAIVARYAEYDRAALGRALADATIDVLRDSLGQTRPAPLEASADALGFALRLVLASDDRSAIVMGLRAAAIYGDSFKLAAEALAYARESDCDDLALALFTLGNMQSARNLEEGARHLHEAADLVDQVDNPRLPLKALHNYAVQQQQRGDVPHAFDAALALARGAARYGWREGEAAANIDLADTYTTLQRDDLAVVCRRHALALLRADGNEAWATTMLFDVAATEMRIGDTTHGVADYEEALALGRTRISAFPLIQNLTVYAESLADAGRINEASGPLNEALLLKPDLRGSLAVEIAKVRLAQHRDREAIELAAGILDKSQDNFYGDVVSRAETIIGRARARLGQRRDAIVALRHAIEIIETRRAALPADELARQRYFTARLEPYYALIDVLVADGRPREALIAAERVKARSLLDTLTFGRVNLAHEMTAADAAREAAAVAEVTRLRKAKTFDGRRMAEARRTLDELRAALHWRYPAAAIKADDLHPLRALAVLPKDAAIVEYVLGPASTFIFVVRDGRVRVKRIAITRAAVTRQVEALHDAVASRRLDYAGFADRVASSLLRPVEPWIASARRLYIVPDGAIWQAPFNLLPDIHGQPLIERHDIAYVPSIALAAQSHERPGPRRLLALGTPAALGAAGEVQSIAEIYGTRADAYVGSVATGQRFLDRAPAYSVIHIAAHAEVFDDWPMESALLLGGRSVTADEILRTPLRCDVTVLAACNTADGHVRDGEGVVGLSWALLGAGCANAVVSQWSVDSEATRRLMVAFHRGYAAGLRPAAALRRAELAMLREPVDAHPFYWAPFVVIASGW
jgi:CHAT domain-containing protein